MKKIFEQPRRSSSEAGAIIRLEVSIPGE